jgi:hypothetical protein
MRWTKSRRLLTSPFRLRTFSTFFVCLCAALTPLAAPLPAAENDLDAFMRQVLVRRDDNWKKLQQYILDEREQMELRGPNLQPLWGERREYTWYIRDGFFVRSPVKFNGAEIGEADRRKYEAEFLRRSQERDQRAAAVASRQSPVDRQSSVDSGQSPADSPETSVDTSVDGLLKQVREPQFVSSAYFLRFKFEEGKYALVGRETLDGNAVLRVEYYPSRLYSDRQRRRMAATHDPDDPRDLEVQRMMNKVALITLWIEPASHQIVKYSFDNVDFDFLPARWLFRIDSVRASMTMSRPFPDVWLPRDLELIVNAQVAVGRFDIRWGVEYRDYRQADVKSRFQVVPGRRE